MTGQIAIRRWGDPCFYEAEEVLEDDFIVEGFFVRRHEVVGIRSWDDE